MADLLLPAVVFVAELVVVTLATVRVIALGRGLKAAAAALGFFEISLWLFAMGLISNRLSEAPCWLAFAGGFTLGNYLGGLIDEKLAFGHALVRVITPRNAAPLAATLNACDYGVTCLDGQGSTGPVTVLFTVIPRKRLGEVLALVRAFDANAFYSVDDLQTTARGVSPLRRRLGSLLPSMLQPRGAAGTLVAH